MELIGRPTRMNSEPVVKLLRPINYKRVKTGGTNDSVEYIYRLLNSNIHAPIRCVISMEKKSKKSLKIMIVEDDTDILTLYSDYLSNRGYHVIARYTRGNNIQTDLERHSPDVFLINSILPGKKNGIEVATEILDVYPSAPILFITADYHQPEEIEKNPIFRDKKVHVLLKPTKLNEIENCILNLVNK